MTQRQQRVLADGWGHQASGSVFCAESSLRYIYESHTAPPHSHAAALTSLAATNDHVYPPNKPLHGPPHGHSHAPPSAHKPTFLKPHDMNMAPQRDADGVDLHEAEIAKACTAIGRQVPSLPHSFRECSVCLAPNAYAQIAACAHTFHPKCFLRWFRMNKSCALCRGAVDKVQLAPVVSVQDELEAIMAEIDDTDQAAKTGELVEPLMDNPDSLMSFLDDAAFDDDMDMVPLEAVFDAKEDTDMEDVSVPEPVLPAPAPAMPMQFPVAAPPQVPVQAPAPMQFAPSSTMPNYWNVINQGMTCPPVAPPAYHQPSQPQHNKMVHIAPKPNVQPIQPFQHPHLEMMHKASPSSFQRSTPPRVVSCRCTGGCRNGRCACVKEGGMCGAACRCTSCKNPFLMVKAAGADIDALLKDSCFMHNVSKTRDMAQRMQEPVDVPCCNKTIKVIDCVQGYTCCQRRFDYSWCTNKLVDHERTPRNHCDICKRCCDHRDVHCDDCGRCYFAGVAASLPCPCKDSSKRRKDVSDDNNNVSSSTPDQKNPSEDGEDKEGEECTIM
ncbi:TPA: hypothetical protein N0F65_005621 [Lagenidium giganteum]|uniref:RING-type domain-containing protein n=1 Tax=Lagenidium giganteum TaxID=4803 RepID=A0AAV2YVX7_9STRA|nr:TPA: hypothetical protein N0F65_005621 [Lagenidium giganteum]